MAGASKGHPDSSKGVRKTYGDPEIGQRLKQFRRAHDLKQEDLARLWNTDRNVVGAYETGRRRFPAERAQSLAARFADLDLNWLFLGKGRPPGGEVEQRLEALERELAELKWVLGLRASGSRDLRLSGHKE